MKNSFSIIKRDITFERNKIAIDLFSKKYRKRIVKQRKEKEVLKEKKDNLI